ncbi:MAG: UvrD-helicase domain-containing protein [Spirochaetaceae bacterium]|nr:UvrD-helicase domain-containing protein [Spirochaetaceae bacterium]
MVFVDLTDEQNTIITSTGNIKINAVAGSGKTTTIIEYARTRSKKSVLLYLAFNRSVRLEAAKRFVDNGLPQVQVETAHSLAYKYTVFKYGYTIRAQGYTTNEIVQLLTIPSVEGKLTEYVLANHINRFLAYFCNSDKETVKALNYLDTLNDSAAEYFVSKYYQFIESQTQRLYNKMDAGAIEITHDFYLKKFQLLNPHLNYDYILFDEGQDASPAMLDVFFKQQSVKVIVGDTHQQIYGWRYAVNSLEKSDFKTYNLSTSFRFSQAIADLAREIISWKRHIPETCFAPPLITGRGAAQTLGSKAVLARTNLGLLLKATQYITEKEALSHIYFEGTINSYTYAHDGTSLYDVLNLYEGKRRLIKDNLIKKMKNIEELEEYIEKTEDQQLRMMVEIVKKYGEEVPGIIKTLKEKHVQRDEKEKAEIIFSTVHRCKGLEYDAIQIVNDFITEKEVLAQKDSSTDRHKLHEEINLLYVAVTRTKNRLYIPQTLVPEQSALSPPIYIIHKAPPVLSATVKPEPSMRLIKKPARKNKPWTENLDRQLMDLYREGMPAGDLAETFSRTPAAIRARLKKLSLSAVLKV